MAKLQPPPKNENTPMFMGRLIKSVYQIFFAIGGGSGVPKIFDIEGAPATDPGWVNSSTINMNEPDGYVKISINGENKLIPYWDE